MPAPPSFREIARNQLLASAAREDLEQLAPHLVLMNFEQGQTFYEPGDPIADVLFPVDGVISMLCVTGAGAVETATIGREGGLGLTAGFGPRESLHRAIVQISGAAYRAPVDAFRRLLQTSPTVRDMAARHTEALLAQVMQSVACNTLHDVEARLARWILICQDRIDGDLVALTQAFLAQMLGVQRTTVSAAAQVLQGRGLIRYRRGKIRVLDRAGLERTACECYAASRRHYAALLDEPERPAA
jgi:CRP-like cAMP-binding protein